MTKKKQKNKKKVISCYVSVLWSFTFLIACDVICVHIPCTFTWKISILDKQTQDYGKKSSRSFYITITTSVFSFTLNFRKGCLSLLILLLLLSFMEWCLSYIVHFCPVPLQNSLAKGANDAHSFAVRDDAQLSVYCSTSLEILPAPCFPQYLCTRYFSYHFVYSFSAFFPAALLPDNYGMTPLTALSVQDLAFHFSSLSSFTISFAIFASVTLQKSMISKLFKWPSFLRFKLPMRHPYKSTYCD